MIKMNHCLRPHRHRRVLFQYHQEYHDEELKFCWQSCFFQDLQVFHNYQHLFLYPHMLCNKLCVMVVLFRV